MTTGYEAGMIPYPIWLLSRRGENPLPRIERRFYDCSGRIVMTLLIAVLRIFNTTEELNKKSDIHMIRMICKIHLVLTADAP
jgi:hypothetical protein